MANNTSADAPKRNATAAEPMKTLSTTIQDVIKKAVTSPNDPKIDFAQGVNHITGDAHQKSAGKADAGQTLSNSYIPEQDEKEKEVVKANTDDDKKKELKANADKEKEVEVKEGELPPALKKAIDAKKEKEDVKEEDDKEKEVVKANTDDEKKKELKANAEKEKEVNEQDEKEKEVVKAQDKKDDEKTLKANADKEKEDVKEEEEKDKEELKANADAEKAKELKAQEIKDKMKKVDVKEDVKALVGNESDLSDEFKNKASTIFEAAVRNKLADEVIRLEDEYADKVKTDTETAKNEIVEKVDGYLNYIVEEWMKENELAVEKGLKSEVAEDFISGLKKLFESHYIDIPEEKYNVIEDQAAKIDELNKKLNESIEKNVELNKDNAKHTRDEILSDVASDLADTEKDKFNGLAENVEYNSADDFRKKVETLKASYFPKSKSTGDEVNDVAGTQDNIDSQVTESMAAYTAAISKQKKLDIYSKK